MELLRRWMEEDTNREPVEGILSAEELEEELRKDSIRFHDSELDFLIDGQLAASQDDEPIEPEAPHEA